MTRRRRAALLLGLALVLGALAAADVHRREAAIDARLGPLTDVVVAREPLPAGRVVTLGDLATRRMPARYAPPGDPVFAAGLAGHRLAVPVAAGAALAPEMLASRPAAPEAAIGRGQRAVDVVAAASARAVVAGARVDVVVTTQHASRLALEDVEVLAARALPDEDGKPPRVTATLRVDVDQAVYLAAAQTFAREVRLLARAPGDRRRAGAFKVGDGLGA